MTYVNGTQPFSLELYAVVGSLTYKIAAKYESPFLAFNPTSFTVGTITALVLTPVTTTVQTTTLYKITITPA
jgi:hypothetical protein